MRFSGRARPGKGSRGPQSRLHLKQPQSAPKNWGPPQPLEDPESLEMMLEACIVDDEDDDETVQEEAEDILKKDWTGLCYTAALRWVRDAEEDWLVVHGTVWSDQAGKRIEHAWCEQGRWVVDLAMPVGSRVVAREAY